MKWSLKPNLASLIESSFQSILINKGRAALTSLGIIIGVSSVILLTSIGNGLKSYISTQFESLGANTVYVMPGQVFSESGGFTPSGMMMTANFTQQDVNTIERKFKSSIVMSASISFADIKSIHAIEKAVEIAGTTANYGPNNNLSPSSGNGRWFTQEEDSKNTPVIVLGNKIATNLFPSGNALGKKVIIKGKNLKVIGIIDKKGGTMGGPGIDEHVFVPLSISFDISGNRNINTIAVKAPSKDLIEKTKKDLTKVMLEKYDSDAFSVFDSSQLLTSINSIISTLTLALTGIAAISLLVGGIGIMNIMLVTVTERTQEIGLRKAIGAQSKAILIQFLIEATTLSCAGGIVGILVGSLGTLAINQFFPAEVTVGSILIAFSVSAAVGIIFGVAPARKASQLSPIEALRHE